MMIMVWMKRFMPIKLRGIKLPTLLIMHQRWLKRWRDRQCETNQHLAHSPFKQHFHSANTRTTHMRIENKTQPKRFLLRHNNITLWASVKLGDTLGMLIWRETIKEIVCCFGGNTDK